MKCSNCGEEMIIPYLGDVCEECFNNLEGGFRQKIRKGYKLREMV